MRALWFVVVNAASESPFEAIRSFVGATATPSDAIESAEEAAREFGLLTPDAVTSEFLRFLAAQAASLATRTGHTPTGIVMSPACGIIGLQLFEGMDGAGRTGHLTCIEPEVQHQQLAKAAFADAGQRPNTFRFLPSNPLDAIGRLAHESYDIAVAECAVEDTRVLVEQTLHALRVGGILVILDTLLDGLVADADRTDRQIIQAREADEAIRSMSAVRVARLPLGAGATIITKVA